MAESHAPEPTGNTARRAPRVDDSVRFSDALAVCRAALLSTSVEVEAPYTAMRQPIAVLASVAYRGGTPPERLIADLKDVLARLPHFEAKNALARGDMMRDLVTFAITSYFARKAD